MNKTIYDTAQLYLDACYEGNGDMVRQAFHKNANLFCLDSRKSLVVESVDNFAAHIDSPPSAKSQNASREEKILFVDYSSDSTATVKLEMLVGNTVYTDYLMMANINGNWQIVSKLYAGREKEF